MSATTIRALMIEQESDQKFPRQIKTIAISDLPDGDVLIKVQYSSLNFKNALSSIGNKRVTRNYPNTPGIDASGEVVISDSDRFKAGDQVLVTGYDLGMNTSGGFGQYIRVPAGWIVPLPSGLTPHESMISGLSTDGLLIYLARHLFDWY